MSLTQSQEAKLERLRASVISKERLSSQDLKTYRNLSERKRLHKQEQYMKINPYYVENNIKF